MLRWALVSNTTIAPLVGRLRAATKKARGGETVFFKSEHGEALPQLYVADSELYAFTPDLVSVYWDIDVVRPGLALSLPFDTAEERGRIREQIIGEMIDVVNAIRTRSTANILFNNVPLPPRTALGVGLDRVYRDEIRRINVALGEAAGSLRQTFLYDLDALWCQVGDTGRDRRFEILAQFPFGAAMQDALVAEWMRYYRALTGLARKCIVVDLDNTLWGGILGEDGPANLEMGDTPGGRPYRRLQEALKALARRGVLLAVASKNNPDETLEVLRSHPDMILRESDFAVIEIGWGDKGTALKRIAQQLNISPEHMVFLDDSPIERNWARAAVEGVLVPDFPEDKAAYPGILAACETDTLALTAEDLTRTQMYLADRERRAFQEEAPSYDEYLSRLALEVEVVPVSEDLLQRAAQLCQRTNQFNLTTRRYNAEQLRALAAAHDSAVLMMKVKDRFGDYGWSALAVIRFDAAVAEIDAFLVSCRVLGRRLEFAFMSVAQKLAGSRGCTHMTGTFIPTPKNPPCARFLDECGFTPLPETDCVRYAAAVDGLGLPDISHISLS